MVGNGETDEPCFPFKEKTEIILKPRCGLDVHTSKEFSLRKRNVSWNFISIIYTVNKQNVCCIMILCRPKSVEGKLDVQITLTQSTYPSNSTVYLRGSETFCIPFNVESEGAVMSEKKTLFTFNSTRSNQGSLKFHVDVTWGCNFSISIGTNPGNPTPSDPDYVAKKLLNLHSTQRLTDMVFVVSGEEIPAHRFMLAAMSEVFRSMFEWDTSEKTTGRVEVKDATASGIKHMLRCIYTSWEPEWDGISDEDLLELAYLAHKYELEPLLAHCKCRMVETLRVENVCLMLKAASTLSLQSVMDCIVNIIKANKTVLKSEEWKTLEENHPRIANEVYRMVFASYL